LMADSGGPLPFSLSSNVLGFDGSTWTVLTTAPLYVTGLQVLDDGSGPKLFAFGSVGVLPTRAVIARWDGTTWSMLGAPIAQGVVNALTVSRISGTPELYAAGNRLTATPGSRHTARWDGTSWVPLADTGTDDIANSLAAVDFGAGERLYVGFTSSSPTAALR